MTAYANYADLLGAFASLSDSDLLALRKSAIRLLDGTQFSEPADLLHEALTRCLDGRRQWPIEVSFPLFLSNAMKSIASADRAHRKAWRSISAKDNANDWSDDWLGGASHPSVEDAALEMERLTAVKAGSEAIRAAFANDPDASLVIEGWMEDQTANEVIAGHGISTRDYDSARKRIQRWAKINGSPKTRRAH